MNILPKKSWHVRNKNNIERVRRDEEKAAEEEKERQKRIAIAESEARTELLRQKSRQSLGEEETVVSTVTQGHINFFEELEKGETVGGKNAEHEQEKKAEKERQEKALGLLKYLGQGSVELEETKPWYFKAPVKRKTDDTASSKSNKEKDEIDAKKKRSSDPMAAMNAYVDQTTKVHRVKHGSSGESVRRSHHSAKSFDTKNAGKSIEQLRAERLHREQQERHRAEQLMAKMRGDKTATTASDPVMDDRQRRYNSQFNPDIARRTHQSDM